jgi:hypothetical protein
MQLNRVFVEPCVRNGCLEPCRCAAIKPVTPWSEAAAAAAAAADEDPLMLPFLPDWCKLDVPPLVQPADYVAPAVVADFRAAWDAAGGENEVLENFGLSFRSVPEAVAAVVETLGLTPQEGTGASRNCP